MGLTVEREQVEDDRDLIVEKDPDGCELESLSHESLVSPADRLDGGSRNKISRKSGILLEEEVVVVEVVGDWDGDGDGDGEAEERK